MSTSKKPRSPGIKAHAIRSSQANQVDKAIEMSVCDISERSRMEEALRESEDRLRFALETSHTGTWDLDLADHTATRSLEHDRIFGYQHLLPQWTYEMFLEHVLPDDRPMVDETFRAAMETHSNWNFECRIRRVDGEVRWIWAAGRHREAEGGVGSRMAGIVQDITERKQVEAELRKALETVRRNEEQLRVLIHNVGAGVALIDEAGKFSVVNPAFLRMFGLGSPTDILNINSQDWNQWEVCGQDRELLHVDDHPARKAAMTGQPVRDQLVGVRSPGARDLTWMSISAEPLLREDGTVRMVICMYHDVTERIRMEEALRQSEYLYRAVGETIEYGVWVCAPDGRNIYASESFLKMVGLTQQECSDFGWGKVLHPDDAARTIAAWQECVRTGGIWDIEHRFLGVDGRWHHVLARGIPVRNAQGAITCWAGINLDIDNLKRTQEALQEAHDELELRVERRTAELRQQADLLDLSHDAIYVRDRDGRILLWTRGATETYGWTAQEALGKVSQELMNTRFPEPMSAVLRKVASEGRWEGEVTQTTRDGRTIVLASRWAAERDESGEVVRILVTNHEITQQKLVQEQLRQSQKMEALGTLTGGIAHDFNNLLAAMIGFTEMAHEDAPEGSNEKRYMERVLQAGLRGRELVKQLLAFSRKTEPEKKPILLSSVLAESMQLLRASLPTTIRIRVNIGRESGPILADPVQVEQVIMNLCTNAAQAMRERGGNLTLHLSTHRVPAGKRTDGMKPGTYLKLTVSDTGCGMTPEVQARIFDPFYTTKEVGQGSGLGLSVVHGIVQQSGGYITVESEPGKGSTFTVYFPLAAKESPAETMVEDTLPTGSERVLFVDDEQLLVEMGREILERLGYRVAVATNSMEALATFTADPAAYDVIISDQTMPEMTGVELARKILRTRPDIPIILCTGFSHVVDEDAARAAGIRAFVMKPLTRSELAKSLRKVLDA